MNSHYVLKIQYVDRPTETRNVTAASTTLGREAGDIVLGDPQTSGRHAEILFEDGRVKIRDLGSTNGTWFGGQRLNEFALEPGQWFQAGQTTLQLMSVEGPPAAGKTMMAMGAPPPATAVAPASTGAAWNPPRPPAPRPPAPINPTPRPTGGYQAGSAATLAGGSAPPPLKPMANPPVAFGSGGRPAAGPVSPTSPLGGIKPPPNFADMATTPFRPASSAQAPAPSESRAPIPTPAAGRAPLSPAAATGGYGSLGALAPTVGYGGAGAGHHQPSPSLSAAFTPPPSGGTNSSSLAAPSQAAASSHAQHQSPSGYGAAQGLYAAAAASAGGLQARDAGPVGYGRDYNSGLNGSNGASTNGSNGSSSPGAFSGYGAPAPSPHGAPPSYGPAASPGTPVPSAYGGPAPYVARDLGGQAPPFSPHGAEAQHNNASPGALSYGTGPALMAPGALAPQTSDGSVRARFTGTGKELFVTFLAGYLLTGLTLGIYMPWFLCKLGQFVANNLTLGPTARGELKVQFTGRGGPLAVLLLGHGLLVLITAGIYAPWFMVRAANFLCENVAAVAPDGTRYHARFNGRGPELLVLMLVNGLLTMLTGGVWMAWYITRMRAYFYSKVELLENGAAAGHIEYVGTGGELFMKLFKGVLLCMVTFGFYFFWMLANLKRYGLARTRITYRGRTYTGSFQGTGLELFELIVGLGTLRFLTLGIYIPRWTVLKLKYDLDNLAYVPVQATGFQPHVLAPAPAYH